MWHPLHTLLAMPLMSMLNSLMFLRNKGQKVIHHVSEVCILVIDDNFSLKGCRHSNCTVLCFEVQKVSLQISRSCHLDDLHYSIK